MNTPGVSLFPNHVVFNFDKIEARSNWDVENADRNNFGFDLTNFKVIAFLNRKVFATDANYPHSASVKVLRIGRTFYRRLCLGQNDSDCYNLLKKFELERLRFNLEDIISRISLNGYWYPRDQYDEGEILNYYDCIICKNILVVRPQTFCLGCKSGILKQGMTREDPSSLTSCRVCGHLFKKKDGCKKCCPPKQ